MNNDELIRTLSEAGHHEEAASLAEKVRKASGDQQAPAAGGHETMNTMIRAAAGYSTEES